MLKAIEMIRVAESVASEILEQASLDAEKIRREAEGRLEEVYRKAYEEAIAEAEFRSKELVENARIIAQREAKEFLHTVEIEVEKAREKASKNFDTAVDIILNELIS